MTRLALIRHGPTRYNEAGRMQGRIDEPLSAAGRAAVGGWRLPSGIDPELTGADWVSSPLIRARETARLARAAAHLFTVAPDGRVAVEQLNLPLDGTGA